MKLLLDTHIALWSLSDNKRLSRRARTLVSDSRNKIFVSAASIWEISVKHSQGRKHGRAIVIPGREALKLFQESGFEVLVVTADHAAAVDDLPTLHGDPFDRLIVAQALSEPLRLVTHDEKLSAYSDSILLV